MKYVIQVDNDGDEDLWYVTDPISLWTDNLRLATRFKSKWDASVQKSILRTQFKIKEKLIIQSVSE